MGRRFAAIASVFLVTLVGLVPAFAGDEPSLDELRKSGVVGERYDGTLVVRGDDAGAEVRSLVKSVNAKRRQIYESRAKKEGAPATEVGKVYALEIVEEAPAGTWFLGEDGKWVRKN